MAKVVFYDRSSDPMLKLNHDIMENYNEYLQCFDTQKCKSDIIDLGQYGKYSCDNILEKLFTSYFETPIVHTDNFDKKYIIRIIPENEVSISSKGGVEIWGPRGFARFEIQFFYSYSINNEINTRKIEILIDFFKDYCNTKRRIYMSTLFYTRNQKIDNCWDEISSDGVILLRDINIYIFEITSDVQKTISDFQPELSSFINRFIISLGSYIFDKDEKELEIFFDKANKKYKGPKDNYNSDYDGNWDDYDDGSYERREQELIERSNECLDDAYEEGYR